ncbi:MAG: hypothetical protein U5K33_09800 [Halofilum sp. (in: g-proteobacteria)]|nr:hypothetical protein [Halofilum sp. (in: g-proteobacteria)]
MHEPIRQDQRYHDFADERAWLGITNAGDTLSSLAFLAVGVAGLVFLWRCRHGSRHFETVSEMYAYVVLFAALAGIGIGSAYYHLAPDDGRLVWDRLPMSIAFMSLLAAVISERINRKWGVYLLPALVLIGPASVGYWIAFDDLRPYGLVQFGSMALLFVFVLWLPSRYTRGQLLLGALALYAIAKLCEMYDREIYQLGEWVGGHTVKHLVAALAGYVILWQLKVRVLRRGSRPADRSSAVPSPFMARDGHPSTQQCLGRQVQEQRIRSHAYDHVGPSGQPDLFDAERRRDPVDVARGIGQPGEHESRERELERQRQGRCVRHGSLAYREFAVQPEQRGRGMPASVTAANHRPALRMPPDTCLPAQCITRQSTAFGPVCGTT